MNNKLEQLDFKLEKNIGILKHAGKVRKSFIFRTAAPSGDLFTATIAWLTWNFITFQNCSVLICPRAKCLSKRVHVRS